MGTLKGVLLTLLLFSWACITNQVSIYSAANTGTLSFEATRVLVNESDGVAHVCVHRTGTVNSFRLYTTAANAMASSDFGAFDGILRMHSNRQCYPLVIHNDDTPESVEPFQVSLSRAMAGDDITFINQTLTVYIIDDDVPEDRPTCTINLVDDIVEERERVVRNVRNLLPLDISVSNTSGGGDVDHLYRDLARTFNRNTSSAGRVRFVAAMDEIFVAYRDECAGAIGVPTREVLTSLAASFREAMRRLNRIPEERLAEARSIYGRFLCYNERTTTRAKRQATIYTPSPTCGCPETVTEPCHFFACLDVAVIQFIAGFGNSMGDSTYGDAPCIGFIVDTTGSMSAEIAAARDIVLQFMRSQADSTFCYVLVPFNDHGVGHPQNVGPITHAFTFGTNTLVLDQLQQFEARVNALRAHSGGEYAEYALDAMLAALDYSFIDEYGDTFTPMESSSKMVVITDATSKNEALETTVINRARGQGVAIHFILSDFGRPVLQTYTVYPNIAAQTGGNLYTDHYSAWSIVNFQLGLATSGPSGRKRRSAPSSTHVSFNVSRFASSLRLTAYSTRSDFRAVTLRILGVAPATIPAERNVVLYLRSDPVAGSYILTADVALDDVVIQQDISLDISVIYMDSAATNSAFDPPPACTSGKIVLTTSRIGEISSLSLNETGPGGSSRLLPLTKCSNAFTRDHHFRAGTFYYQIQGVDTNGVEFAYNFNRSAVVSVRPSLYSLRPTSTSPLPVEYSTPFTVGFVLRNNDSIGSTDFTLSAAAPGFTVSLDSSTVQLLPKQTRTITVTGRVGSTVGGGTSHPLTLTANNGCVVLSASRMVTVRAVSSPSLSHSTSTSNVCGCQNGGTCNVITRRGRTFTRCSCTSEYGGPTCEIGI